MRALIASIAALTAIFFATPSFAQQELPAADTTAPAAKPKPGTSAYCNTLKSASSKSACLKRVQAQTKAPATSPSPTAQPQTPRAKAKATKPAPAANTSKPDTTAAAPAAPSPVPQSTVAVPPLPQKTI